MVFFYIYADIKECATDNGGCSDNCQELLGSHKCLCPSGFELGPDRKTCIGKKLIIQLLELLTWKETRK